MLSILDVQRICVFLCREGAVWVFLHNKEYRLRLKFHVQMNSFQWVLHNAPLPTYPIKVEIL